MELVNTSITEFTPDPVDTGELNIQVQRLWSGARQLDTTFKDIARFLVIKAYGENVLVQGVSNQADFLKQMKRSLATNGLNRMPDEHSRYSTIIPEYELYSRTAVSLADEYGGDLPAIRRSQKALRKWVKEFSMRVISTFNELIAIPPVVALDHSINIQVEEDEIEEWEDQNQIVETPPLTPDARDAVNDIPISGEKADNTDDEGGGSGGIKKYLNQIFGNSATGTPKTPKTEISADASTDFDGNLVVSFTDEIADSLPAGRSLFFVCRTPPDGERPPNDKLTLTTSKCICCMDPADVIAIPCGHFLWCYECLQENGKQVSQCSRCREPVTQYQRVWF